MAEFPPFALVVDDGSLEACCEVLSLLQLDWMRVGTSGSVPFLWPTDLLISDEHGVPLLASVEPEDRIDASWLCVIDSDTDDEALERLRSAGVHFIFRRDADGSLDRELLRLLFLQMAYAGAERRGCARLLCWHEVTYAVDRHRGKARLLDLSTSAARVLTAYAVPRASELQLYLPSELDPQAPTAYPALVVRSAPATSAEGRYMTHLVLEFRLSRELKAQLEYVVATQARSPALSRLAEHRMDELSLEQEDRRIVSRHAYPHEVAALRYFGSQAPLLVRTHEISLRGMRVGPTQELEMGQRVVLGLYRGASESPLMLHAQVRRDDGDRGLWLAFDRMRGDDKEELKRVLAALPAVEDLAYGPSGESGPIFVATAEFEIGS